MILWILYRKKVDFGEMESGSELEIPNHMLWTMGKDKRYVVTPDDGNVLVPGTFWATNRKSEIRDFLRNSRLKVGKRRFLSWRGDFRNLYRPLRFPKCLPCVGYKLVSKYPNAIKVPKYPHVPMGIETSNDVWDNEACSVEFWKEGGENGEDLVVAQGDYYTAKIPAKELYEYLKGVYGK